MVNSPKASGNDGINSFSSFEGLLNTVTIPQNATYLPPGQQVVVRLTHPAVRSRQISETITNKKKCPITAEILDKTHRLSSEILQQVEQGTFKEAVTRGLAVGIPLACGIYGSNELLPDSASPSFQPSRLLVCSCPSLSVSPCKPKMQ